MDDHDRRHPPEALSRTLRRWEREADRGFPASQSYGGGVMAADHVAVASEPLGRDSSVGSARRPLPSRPRWRLGIWALAIVLAVGSGMVFMAVTEKQSSDEPGPKGAAEGRAEKEHGEAGGSMPNVQVVEPRRGGMARTTNQPGSVMAFDFAPLFAKVSGYLSKLKVDRGSRVKKDELLLEIYDPELDAAVEQAQAALDRAKAAVDVAVAHVAVAKASVVAAEAMRHKAQADLQNAVARREYRYKQLGRITDLARRDAIEERVVDEQKDDYQAAIAAEQSAHAGIETADAQVLEAKANQEKAEADLKAARSDVKVREADLKKARVFLEYTRLTAPYDGVIIARGEAVHPGAFIQAATQGNGEPLLTVANDDLMRTIILVPDRDVAYCNIGDPAIIAWTRWAAGNSGAPSTGWPSPRTSRTGPCASRSTSAIPITGSATACGAAPRSSSRKIRRISRCPPPASSIGTARPRVASRSSEMGRSTGSRSASAGIMGCSARSSAASTRRCRWSDSPTASMADGTPVKVISGSPPTAPGIPTGEEEKASGAAPHAEDAQPAHH